MMNTFYEDDQIVGDRGHYSIRKAFYSLLPYLKVHKSRLFFCLGLLVVAALLSLTWPWLIQQAIDVHLSSQLELPVKEREFGMIIMIGLAIFAIQIATLFLLYWQRVKLEMIGQDVMLQLKRELFDHIVSLDLTFFDSNPVGRLMSRVESDAESLRMLFTNTVVLVLGDLVLMVGLYAMMLYINWKLALVVMAIFPVLIVLVVIFHKMTTHRFLEVRKRMAEVTATLTEFLHGMSIIQIFHRGEYARERVYRANERKFSEDSHVNIAVCIFFNTLFYFEYVKIGLILLFGAMWNVSAGIMVMFILLIWKEFDPIARTADQLGSFQKGIAGARRIFELLEVKPRLFDPANPKEWSGLRDCIRFENVWFSYTDDENWVLKDATFEIRKGQRIALVGVTGGGKSTVINLLLRMYDPQKGRITVDGIDIRDICRDDLRHAFALVLQDIILFPGNVASNIGLEVEGVSGEQIRQATRIVSADRFIERLPNGFRTEVSEKGQNFSRGERQLLSFARALVVNPDVLILDEATSSVDPETERTIQASLKLLMKGRTSLIIAHRLSTILDVDQILVIKRGEILERGTHAELILQNGYYSKLFHLQFKQKNGVENNVS